MTLNTVGQRTWICINIEVSRLGPIFEPVANRTPHVDNCPERPEDQAEDQVNEPFKEIGFYVEFEISLHGFIPTFSQMSISSGMTSPASNRAFTLPAST